MTTLAAHGRMLSALVSLTVAILNPFSSRLLSQSGVASPTKGTLVVTDSGGKAVPFATVQVNGGAARVTDLEGRVFLGNNIKDSVRVLVRRIGYVAFEGKLGASTADGSFRAIIPATAQTLAAMRINAARVSSLLERTGFYDRMAESQRGLYNGEFYTPELLESRVAAQASQILQNSKFARVEYKEGRNPVIRGRAGCVMEIVIDGHRANRIFDGDGPLRDNSMKRVGRMTLDELVAAGDIAAIEVYPHVGNAPGALQPLTGSGSCGIVAIWTGGR